MAKNKTVFAVICLITICGCNSAIRYDAKVYNLNLAYNDHLTVDFNSGIVRVDIDGFKYNDTLALASDDRTRITDAFESCGIGRLEGFKKYSGQNVSLPPEFMRMSIYKENKIKSDIEMSYEYGDSQNPSSSEGKKIVEFRNIVNKVIQNDVRFKKAFKICTDQLIKTGNIRM